MISVVFYFMQTFLNNYTNIQIECNAVELRSHGENLYIKLFMFGVILWFELSRFDLENIKHIRSHVCLHLNRFILYFEIWIVEIRTV